MWLTEYTPSLADSTIFLDHIFNGIKTTSTMASSKSPEERVILEVNEQCKNNYHKSTCTVHVSTSISMLIMHATMLIIIMQFHKALSTVTSYVTIIGIYCPFEVCYSVSVPNVIQ